jgi:ADP-ribose pyrophosphatase
MIASLDVVVGILFNSENEVLIALRPSHVIQPGVWEFPGGKVEPNETLEHALVREYREEIGIEILKSEFLIKIVVPARSQQLILHTFKILEYTGEPRGCENQEIRFVPIHTLNNYEFPRANSGIIKQIQSVFF